MQLLQKDLSFICSFGHYLPIVQSSFGFLFHYQREHQTNLDLSIINAWNFLPRIYVGLKQTKSNRQSSALTFSPTTVRV